MASKTLDSLGECPPRKREHEQRNRDTHRERERLKQGVGTDRTFGARNRDDRENRTGARHEDRAECDAEQESTVVSGGLPLRDPGEWLLEDRLEARDDEADADEHQEHDADPDDRLLRQVQQAKKE